MQSVWVFSPYQFRTYSALPAFTVLGTQCYPRLFPQEHTQWIIGEPMILICEGKLVS